MAKKNVLGVGEKGVVFHFSALFSPKFLCREGFCSIHYIVIEDV